MDTRLDGVGVSPAPDTLIIWKIDWLGRNLRDLVDVVAALEVRGVGVKSR